MLACLPARPAFWLKESYLLEDSPPQCGHWHAVPHSQLVAH